MPNSRINADEVAHVGDALTLLLGLLDRPLSVALDREKNKLIDRIQEA
jgi:hypothetical protein